MVAQFTKFDTIIVGGGLAGLTAAALVSSARQKVCVIEKRSSFGGRGASHNLDGGFIFNQGPHALYNDGAARRLFQRLGLQMTGSYPTQDLNLLLNGRLARLPVTLADILTSRTFSIKGKIEVIGFLAGINSINCDAIAHLDFESWLRKRVRNEATRQFLHALGRVSTYADGMNFMSAGAVIAQLKAALKGGVTYLDGGWQSLVDQLVALCNRHDVTLLTSTNVQSLLPRESGANIELLLSTGERIRGSNLVVALPPGPARNLLSSSAYVKQVTSDLIPIKAACLDLALTKLPNDKLTFVLNLDKPYYYSVHSAYSRLTTSGVMLHVMKYLPPAGDAGGSAKEELEQYLDILQPGWRECVIHERF